MHRELCLLSVLVLTNFVSGILDVSKSEVTERTQLLKFIHCKVHSSIDRASTASDKDVWKPRNMMAVPLGRFHLRGSTSPPRNLALGGPAAGVPRDRAEGVTCSRGAC